ncbi:chemotaxis protein CheB [Algoriphagus sp.]|uniref:chemotaxis protein CheB n=1 Tax=Algoriphagus sp. TaxID=1872435 RepID=UPI0027217B76|nr:chemotaxis protein CheB [Algoriphagus sp.]MDO8965262.1 CheR family methyltransferase [Algoriphagus sp.]MDP3198976.1 CheR family methyltransferase [Algoriphagus sp.]
MEKKNALKTNEDPVSSDNKILPEAQFSIVAIGASAGGLEALEQFFSNMPSDTGLAFVVIQHLDPTHVGILPELLQRVTQMKVQQATDGLLVKPDCVYVIPPNKSLSVLNGHLHLLVPVESRGLRLPIDFFMKSLAIDRLQNSVGVILSGMGSDGTQGIKAIKEKNGLVLVQDPISAKFDGMPISAREAVIADVIAPATELPARLLAILKQIPEVGPDKSIDEKSKSHLDKIIILLREQSGHDFSNYKKNTLLRRIERRKGVHQIDKINSYVRFLQENPAEVEILFKELLIGVTSFFRDPEVWEKLKDSTLPEMIKEAPNRHVFRAWVTACSTGEEAYSLAMIFKEVLEKSQNGRGLSLQIFATDLDKDAIEKARSGVYPENIAAEVSPERLTRFFTVESSGYRISNSIREMVVFAPQNIIKDPPFTKLDILTCRNMLIYMEPDLQKKLISLFNYSLNQDGILVLGTAETLGSSTEGFREIENKLKIYKRTSALSPAELADFPSAFFRNRRFTSEKKLPQKSLDSIQTVTEQLLLQRFAPSSVLVNDRGDILFITGRTGKYLEPAAGKANMNIHAMVREGLNQEISDALRKANRDLSPVFIKNAKVQSNGIDNYVDVTVQRLDAPEAVKGLTIIVFSEVKSPVEKAVGKGRVGKSRSSLKLKELDEQLRRSHEDLQSTREEMQTSQEELKSTNEELQSTNEELQSTNEELTTSKEEMQSMNEELQTVNIELQSKVNDFVRANDDMKNLLNSTEIATLFLDKEFNIRRFTDNAQSIVKIRKSDIGRPFTDLVTELDYPEFGQHVKEVLKSLKTIESCISAKDERWFSIRIMPYRTLEDKIDGVVITFTDITVAKSLEIKLKELNDKLQKDNKGKK